MTTRTGHRSRLRILAAVIAALVVLGVGVPFVYIHFIEGSAPAKFTLSSSPSASGTSGGTVALDGTWSVAAGSQAGYRVGEVLFGQNNTAVGRTTHVTGSIAIKGTTVESGSFTVDMTTVHSDQSQRDGQFQGRIMDTSKYPTGTFTLTKPIDLGTPPASSVTMKVTAQGNLTLRGVTQPVTIPLTVEHVGTTLDVLGDVNLVFANWKIPNPSFAGTVTTQDHGTLEFLLHFSHGSSQEAAAGPSTTTASATSGGIAGRGGANQAFQACLVQHGVKLPSAPTGEAGGGFNPGGPRVPQTPQEQAAFQACGNLLPARGQPTQPTISPTTVPAFKLSN